MGTCCHCRPNYLEDLNFKQLVDLEITERYASGEYMGQTNINLVLTPPTDQKSAFLSLDKKMRVSGCVISGLDPRCQTEKDCQDSYVFSSNNSTFFAALFDGHGRDGKRVSLYCRDFMQRYFEMNTLSFEKDAKAAIDLMINKCETELSLNGIECKLSGTTAVVMVVSSEGATVGSVGDSRAVLATKPMSKDASMPTRKSSKYFRRIRPRRVLNAIALTVDQKPNHEDELKRIQLAGGNVAKITDSRGRGVGLYRVWNSKNKLPGLAMSRSIGDQLAHEIGVISSPIFHTFNIYPRFDQFIVIASDGVWDVMDNSEVVDFVERFRYSCTGDTNLYPAKPENSSISRMLCEEARYRWLGVVQRDDVMIDDISCIVVEVGNVEPGERVEIPEKERAAEKQKSIAVNGIMQEGRGVARKDPARGSVTEANEDIEEVLGEINAIAKFSE